MVTNLQSRKVPAPPEVVGALVDRLADPDGGVWPSPPWPPLRLDHGLTPGSRGGHGPIRYEVVDHEPGVRTRFRFDPAIGVDGYHEFTVTAVDGGTELRHLLVGRMHGRMHWAWPLAVRWLHAALLADLLDNVERATTGSVRRPARWSPWVRLLRRAFRRPEAAGQLTASTRPRQ